MKTISILMCTIARAAIPASILMLLAACAGQQTRLTPDDLRSLSSQPQVHVVHHMPARAFWVEGSGYTAVGVLLSPLVVIAQGHESMKLREDLRLDDPAPRVKERLIHALPTNSANMRVVSTPPKNDDVGTLKEFFQTGVVLDVRTMKWGIDNNRAKYSARARLVRLADSAVVWEATCNEFIAGKAEPRPTREALVANDGELLKARLREAADGCADQLAAWATGKGS